MRLLIPFVVACSGTPVELDLALSPADGQSDVGAFQPLVLLGDVQFPEEAPTPQVIRVVSLPDGGFVDGQVLPFGRGLAFWPDDPWPVDRSFVWTVVQPLDDVRQPTLRLPDSILGSATFHTDNRVEVLAATVPPTNELCLVASRPLLSADVGRLALSVNDEPARIASVRWLEPDQLGARELPEDDAGLGAACVVVDGGAEAGDRLRSTIDGRSTLVVVQDAPTVDVVASLRRESMP
ncbi:MAG: hypothetical protein H6736_17020 [Alphaproteobacteria bacterium]|nr:hypothetical protein [Alphaproteobacteria bacterium]MCB9693516.1 hypothetical protein [Alphaproteobacteria bacterium]